MACPRLFPLSLLSILFLIYALSTFAMSTPAGSTPTLNLPVYPTLNPYAPLPANIQLPSHWLLSPIHPKFFREYHNYRYPQLSTPTHTSVNPALITMGPGSDTSRAAGGYWARRFRPGTRRPSLDRFEDVWVPYEDRAGG